MERIVSKEVMRKRDELTLTTFDITSFELMQKAAKAIFDHIIHHKFITHHQQVCVIAGLGNNGGDGIVLATLLRNTNVDVSLCLVGNPKHQSIENKEALEAWNDDVVWLEEDINNLRSTAKKADTIIDAIFGIGLARDVTGIYKKVIQYINKTKKQVISIDMPSGLHANNGLVMGAAVKADHTIVVQSYKRGNILNQAKDYNGKLHLVDAGIVDIVGEKKEYVFQMSRKYYIEKRKHHSHKYHFGFTHVIGGSKGMMGAPLLSAFAAYKSGTGLASISYHTKNLSDITPIYPEIMINTYQDIEELQEQLQKKTAIVFGPGLGRKNGMNKACLETILDTKKPVLIDADGIYYFKEVIDSLPHNNIVITPHTGEMAYLCGVTTSEILTDPIKYIKHIMRKYNICVVLKGTTTIIANDCEIYYSTIGSPGLATAGSGDVLAGIIGSLLARGYSKLKASLIGVYIHSAASIIADSELGEESMSASDLFTYIPTIIKSIKKKV